MIHDKAKVVAHLRGLADESVEPFRRDVGICENLSVEFGGEWDSFVADTAHDWPEFSGSIILPVPHPHLNRRAAYCLPDLWIDEYGASRRRLCAHLADKIEAMEGELEV